MHGTNPKVYPNIVTTLQLSKLYDKCDHLCKLKEEVCKVAYINYRNFPTERNGAETSGSKSFSFPKLRSFWSAAGIEIDPCRWPKGSKLWEREWLKIAKICADTAGAEAIVLWTIVMNEQALCTQENWFAQFARILARQLFVGVDKWANGGWLIDQ